MSLEELVTPLRTVWRFDYESKVRALRDLYEVAKREQWNAASDIPWDDGIAFDGEILDPRQDALQDFDFIERLPEAKRKELSIRRSAWTLSQFLHGEQGALLCCGQLVEAVPDIDGKLYAATQVIDEARHVEVFHRYIQRLDRVYPISAVMRQVLDAVLQADMWQMKCVGMQVIAESVAMGTFKIMQEGTKDDLLRRIVQLTAQDEARHVSYGLIYMKDELPRMPDEDRERVEDFALATVRMMTGNQGMRGLGPQAALLQEAGIDLEQAAAELREKLSDPAFLARRPNTLRDYVMPQLQRLGIVTERTAPGYRELGFAV
jgi:hypothetical protein